MNESIGLAELVFQVKRELMQRAPAGTDPVPLLSVEDVDLEIKIGVTKQGKAGVQIYVLQLGAEGKLEEVHTVRVKLRPLLSREERVDALRNEPDWHAIERAAVEHLTKGPSGEQLIDQY